jgi:hypothetical protein
MRCLRAACVAALVSSACGSTASAPVAPTIPVPVGNPAVISVTNVAATLDVTSGAAVYHVSFQVVETSGQTGATFKSVTFIFSNGFAGGGFVYTLPAPIHVAGGGTVSVGPIAVPDGTGNVATQISANISYADDGGHVGLASGSASMPALTFNLAGFVRDSASGQVISGATVEVTTGPSSGAEQTSNASGAYAFTALQAGTFTMQGIAPGYPAATQTVVLTGNANVDVLLTVAPPAAASSVRARR